MTFSNCRRDMELGEDAWRCFILNLVFVDKRGFQPVCTFIILLHMGCTIARMSVQEGLRHSPEPPKEKTLRYSVLCAASQREGCSLIARGAQACACTVRKCTSSVGSCSRRGLFQLGGCTFWVGSAGRSSLNATGTEVNHTAPAEQPVALQWWDQAVSRGAQLRQGFCFEIASWAKSHSLLVAEAPVG